MLEAQAEEHLDHVHKLTHERTVKNGKQKNGLNTLADEISKTTEAGK